MILPIRTDSPLRSTPWMNWLLIALNVLAFMAQSRFPQITERFSVNGAFPQLYQFVTYAFLHADIWHIAGNMLFLYIFGNNVCDRFGNDVHPLGSIEHQRIVGRQMAHDLVDFGDGKIEPLC